MDSFRSLLGSLQAPVLVQFRVHFWRSHELEGLVMHIGWFPVISRFKPSEQLNFQFNYHRPRRVGKFPVRVDLHFSVSQLSRQLLFEQQFQVPPERWKEEVPLELKSALPPLQFN